MKTKNAATIYAILAAALYAINIPVSKLFLTHTGTTMMAAFLYLGAGMGLIIYGGIERLAKTEKKTGRLTRKDWALVSAGSKKKANTMTVSWGGVGVLWGKNVAFIFVRDSRYTKEFIDAGDFFSVSFMGKNYKDALNYCGSHSGRDCNKVAEAGLHWNYKHSIPFIDEGSFILLCHKVASVKITEDCFLSPEISKWYKDGDMHTMYVGEIMDFMAK